MTLKFTKSFLLFALCSVFALPGFAQFSGNINVGTGQTYTSLTNTGGLFAAINNGTVTGNITVKITSNLTAETGLVSLNKWTETGVGNYKMNIVPDGTTERLISSKSQNLITISGAVNVSINGSPTNNGSKYLRFRNDSINSTVATSTICFINDAKLDTIQNCYVEGASGSTVSGVVLLGASTGTAGNDSIAILNNVIRDITGTANYIGAPYALVMNYNTGTNKNDNIVIAGNQFLNWTFAAVYLRTSGNKNSILNNNLYITSGPRSTVLYGINIAATGGNGHVISGNSIGGSTAGRGGTAMSTNNTFYGVYQSSTGDTTIISNNTIGNISALSIYGMYHTGSVYANINNNIIGGSATSYSDTLVCSTGNGNGIYAESAFIIKGNQIRRITSTGGNAAGMFLSAATKAVVDNNTIDSINGNRPINLGSNYTPSGIQVSSTNSGTGNRTVVSNNTISNIINPNTTYTTNYAGASGIQLGGTGAPNIVFNNKISAIYGANTNSTYGSNVGGIYHSATTVDSIYNNQVILGDRTVPATWLRGLIEASTSATNSSHYFNNSVYLKNNGVTPYNINSNATAGVTKSGSQVFYRTSNSPVSVKNNIFYNTATNTGTAMVAAVYSNSTTNWNCDYNLLYTVDTSKLNYFGATPTSYGLNTWRANALSDTNSLCAIVPFASATDLHINAANANAWNVFGRGIAISTGSRDIDSNLRSTVVGTPVCIGFDELTSQPSVAPANMIMTPSTPVLGTPTVFTSGGRKIAEITWTGTTVPTSLSAKYYPGLQAPGATTTPNINSYFDVTATPDNGSAYTIKMYYTTAEAAGIAEADLRGIKKHGTNNYTGISNPGANAFDIGGKYITSNTQNDFSIFSMTGATVPLAITMTGITASNVQNSNRIDWKTQSEASGDKFEMERSTDGKIFSRIAVINAKGKAGGYTYWDNAAVTGKNYYRIKISKENGDAYYSNVAIATVVAAKSFVMSVYPNPAQNNINIRIDGNINANASIQIMNIAGKVLKGMPVTGNELNINVKDIPAGNYILHYTDNTQMHSLKITKQ